MRMVESGDAFCNRLPLTDELREDLGKIRKIKARGALKRQIKHLAGLLRHDPESVAAIQAAFETVGRANRAEKDAFHHIEHLRDALCDPDGFAEALDRAANELPGLDRPTFTRLAKSVHKTGDKKLPRDLPPPPRTDGGVRRGLKTVPRKVPGPPHILARSHTEFTINLNSRIPFPTSKMIPQ